MKNKFISFIIIYLFIFCINIYFSNTNAVTDDKMFPEINVPSAVVIDADTGRILYDKNCTEKRPMASLTKVMTSILLVENCDMNELIEVPIQAVSIGGSTVGLRKGDKISAKSLLYGMLLPSR